MQSQLFPILNLGLWCVVNNEIGLLFEVGFALRTDKHVGYKVSLPCHLNDKAHLHACIFVGTAEAIYDKKTLIGQLFLCNLFHSSPCFLACTVIIVVIFLRIPPNGIVWSLVIHDKLVLRWATCVDTCHDIDGAELCFVANLKTFETFFRLFIEQNFVRRIVKYLFGTCNTILFEYGFVKLCHF